MPLDSLSWRQRLAFQHPIQSLAGLEQDDKLSWSQEAHYRCAMAIWYNKDVDGWFWVVWVKILGNKKQRSNGRRRRLIAKLTRLGEKLFMRPSLQLHVGDARRRETEVDQSELCYLETRPLTEPELGLLYSLMFREEATPSASR